MRINSLNGKTAYRYGGLNTNSKTISLAKLSSGLRINSAKDDASGLAISEKMKAQIRGLNQANSNISYGINLSSTAEGGTAEIEEMVQRMRELTVQAANDTNTYEDRLAIQTEIDQLTEEIDSTAENQEYNKIKVLNAADPVVISGGVTTVGPTTTTSVLSDVITGSTSYVKLPKGTALPADTSNTVTQTSTSYDVSYDESEESLGQYVAGDWRDYYYFESEEVVSVATTETTIDTTEHYTGTIIQSEVSTPASIVSTNGVPRFTANSAAGTTINLYCALTRADLRIGSNVYSLYDQPSTQVIDGSGNVINTYNIEGIQITQTVSLASDASGDGTYSVSFNFENVTVPESQVDFDFKFSMDAMNTYGATETADPATGTLDTDDATVVITGNADTTNFGDIYSLINNFDPPADLGSFDGHSGAALYWNVSLADHTETDSGTMDYAVDLKTDYYQLNTAVETKTEQTATTTINTTDEIYVPEQLAIQNGANSGQVFALRLFNLTSLKIGLTHPDEFGVMQEGILVDSYDNCQESLETLDRVINKISKIRAYSGAAQNRMNTMMNSNGVTEENLTRSNSKITDADMAKEMMAFVKSNILGQASTAMLAQSNNLDTEMMQGLLQSLNG